ncbi:MAG TPA: hypothetical protein VJG32_02940 [Anaerolineae bacterium]|nr:hypothetical protein [Anaerolineae bacterium]
MSVVQQIRTAQALHREDRRRGWAALNDLFRAGTPPHSPLAGRYAGELIAVNIAPGLTQFVEWQAARWMPWRGKTFDAARASGDNIFTRDSLFAAHLYFPLYRGYLDDGPQTYCAFPFRTTIAPGRADPDRQVLKIDYNLPGNPRPTVQRVLDELVQVDEQLYLGKAHFKWWWGRWQLVAYFTLTQSESADRRGLPS